MSNEAIVTIPPEVVRTLASSTVLVKASSLVNLDLAGIVVERGFRVLSLEVIELSLAAMIRSTLLKMHKFEEIEFNRPCHGKEGRKEGMKLSGGGSKTFALEEFTQLDGTIIIVLRTALLMVAASQLIRRPSTQLHLQALSKWSVHALRENGFHVIFRLVRRQRPGGGSFA
jgi:hypothetical protein